MLEGSVKGPIDRETEVEVRIKQARLEVERSYRSTLDVLSNDLKNAKEELAQRDAIFEVRVRKHRSTILTLQEDLGIVTGSMEQQEEEYKKEKVQLNCTQSKLHNQVKASMEREREIARRFSAYQVECEVERGQRIAERDALHHQIEELQEQRENLTHEVNTTRHWLQNCYDNMNEARDRVLQLRDALNDVYAGYLHQNDERLGRQARVLAPHLPKALARIYKGLGDD